MLNARLHTTIYAAIHARVHAHIPIHAPMHSLIQMLVRLPQRALMAVIRVYRFLLSPWVGNACRYWPTCSEYALEAIETHGAVRGGWLMVGRLARCHPYGAGGVDPVPQAFRWRCACGTNHAQNAEPAVPPQHAQ